MTRTDVADPRSETDLSAVVVDGVRPRNELATDVLHAITTRENQ